MFEAFTTMMDGLVEAGPEVIAMMNFTLAFLVGVPGGYLFKAPGTRTRETILYVLTYGIAAWMFVQGFYYFFSGLHLLCIAADVFGQLLGYLAGIFLGMKIFEVRLKRRVSENDVTNELVSRIEKDLPAEFIIFPDGIAFSDPKQPRSLEGYYKSSFLSTARVMGFNGDAIDFKERGYLNLSVDAMSALAELLKKRFPRYKAQEIGHTETREIEHDWDAGGHVNLDTGEVFYTPGGSYTETIEHTVIDRYVFTLIQTAQVSAQTGDEREVPPAPQLRSW